MPSELWLVVSVRWCQLLEYELIVVALILLPPLRVSANLVAAPTTTVRIASTIIPISAIITTAWLTC